MKVVEVRGRLRPSLETTAALIATMLLSACYSEPPGFTSTTDAVQVGELFNCRDLGWEPDNAGTRLLAGCVGQRVLDAKDAPAGTYPPYDKNDELKCLNEIGKRLGVGDDAIETPASAEYEDGYAKCVLDAIDE